MTDEAVLYFDVLGFRQMARGRGVHAKDTLSVLAGLLRSEKILFAGKRWKRRYALGDSVFLTHRDPTAAIEMASALFFTLFQMNERDPLPVLVRGALAHGRVRHVKGVFERSSGNLVGEAVVEAVMLEQTSGLKGPRLLVSDGLARQTPAILRRWLLRPTSAPRAWECLWPLPADPKDRIDETSLARIAAQALEGRAEPAPMRLRLITESS